MAVRTELTYLRPLWLTVSDRRSRDAHGVAPVLLTGLLVFGFSARHQRARRFPCEDGPEQCEGVR